MSLSKKVPHKVIIPRGGWTAVRPVRDPAGKYGTMQSLSEEIAVLDQKRTELFEKRDELRRTHADLGALALTLESWLRTLRTTGFQWFDQEFSEPIELQKKHWLEAEEAVNDGKHVDLLTLSFRLDCKIVLRSYNSSDSMMGLKLVLVGDPNKNRITEVALNFTNAKTARISISALQRLFEREIDNGAFRPLYRLMGDRSSAGPFISWLMLLYLAGEELYEFATLRRKDVTYETDDEREAVSNFLHELEPFCGCCARVLDTGETLEMPSMAGMRDHVQGAFTQRKLLKMRSFVALFRSVAPRGLERMPDERLLPRERPNIEAAEKVLSDGGLLDRKSLVRLILEYVPASERGHLVTGEKRKRIEAEITYISSSSSSSSSEDEDSSSSSDDDDSVMDEDEDDSTGNGDDQVDEDIWAALEVFESDKAMSGPPAKRHKRVL